MIKENELKSIKEIGSINGNPVKEMRFIGGLYMAVYKNSKGEDEVLGAASHPALLSFNIEQKFGGSYQPAMNKSEGENEGQIYDLSKFLDKKSLSRGYTLVSLEKNNTLDLILTKMGIEIVCFPFLIKNNMLEKQPVSFLSNEEINNISGKVFAEALKERASSLNKTIKI
jgi:hypothetical protein